MSLFRSFRSVLFDWSVAFVVVYAFALAVATPMLWFLKEVTK